MTEEKLIKWDNAFDLGVKEIDDDHLELVETLNNLNDLIKSNEPSEKILALLENCHQALLKHFHNENKIVAKYIPDEEAKKHIYFHTVTADYILDLINQYKEDPEAVSAADMMHYLHGWIIDHIINQDHEMRPHLEKAGLVKSEADDESLLARILDSFRLSTRISALATIPLIAMLFFAGNAVLEKRVIVLEMEKIEQLSGMAGTFGSFVHELQKERGASAGFLGSKGNAFGDKVIAQRKNTAEKQKPIAQALSLGEKLGLNEAITKIRERLAQLPDIRKKIDAQEITVAQEVGFYSALNADLLNSIAAMSKISNDINMSNQISAFVNFLQSKERAGIERAKGAIGFANSGFPAALLKDFISLIAIQDSYMAVSKSFASAEILNFMGKTISGPTVKAVEDMRNIAISSPMSRSTGGITGPQWFDGVTKKINLLKQVENHMGRTLIEQASKTKSSAQTAFITLLIISALIAIGILVFAMVVVRSIIKPLAQLRTSIELLEAGRTETMIAGRHKSDELGEMARAIQSFKESIIRHNIEQARQGIEQSVRERTSVRRQDATEVFKGNVASVLLDVSEAATQLETNAESMSAATDISRSQSATVASAATQATANVETVAAAAEELSSSIQEISRQVEHSTTIANTATQTAIEAQQTIEGLAQGATKIGEVVTMITGIAEQTNLLALNATIEAARAGEAGKGFAVVATEVKNLADQTSKATEDITNQINTIQDDTQKAVDAIAEVSRTINEMNEVTYSVSQAVDQQGSATQEISTNVNEAATGTRDVSNNIEGVALAAEETGKLSGDVFTSAKLVSDNATDLRQQIDNFLQEVSDK